MEGNKMKMREALVGTLDALKSLSKSHGTDLPEDVRALLGGMAFTINAALSAPARNCDVGTPEEQTRRMFSEFCCQYECYELPSGKHCPLYHEGIDCRFTWAQMPYVAEEGGAK